LSWSKGPESSSAAAAVLAAAGVAAVIRGDVSGRDGRCIWADAVCKTPLAACEQKSALDEIDAALRLLRGDAVERGAGANAGEVSISREKGLVEIAWFLAPRVFIGFATSPDGGSRFVALWQPDAEPTSLARHKDLLRVAVCYEMLTLRRSRTATSAAFAAKIAAETLNRLAIPLFVVGLDREIVRMNAAARAWLRSDGRLCLSNRRLIGGSAVLNAQLRTAISRATAGPSPDLAIMPLVDGADNRPAVTLSCAPMPEPRDHVLIAIQERRCDLNLAQQTLTALGLTQAERRLASFMATGMSLQKAATASGITFSTARSYLKRIFGKLGIARQSDLVGLVAALTPVFMRDDVGKVASGLVPDFADEPEPDGAHHDTEAALPRRARHDIRLMLADGLAGDQGKEPAPEPYR
jgi:DNA-binding CsgD family transcriptional regulator